MAEPFQYYFDERLVEHASQRDEEDPDGGPLVGEIVEEAAKTVSVIEQFRELPERNQKFIQHMASDMILAANRMADSSQVTGREHFWGLYMIGSRAKGKARPDSDVDLLSVGSFGLALNF